MYDIVFISYNEPNADATWQALKDNFPRAKRIDGVKGIHQAHIAAAKKCFTKMFWVVDADAQILDTFNFDHKVDEYDLETVHVWRSRNPVNNLLYGYGGVKLLPRKLTLNMDTTKPDMTTSISEYFKAMPETSNVTAFNTNEFEAWKGAFRECTKLASKSITGQIDDETEDRLQAWLHPIPAASFSNEAKRGAEQGTVFGKENKNKPEVLALINDFDWLEEKFSGQ